MSMNELHFYVYISLFILENSWWKVISTIKSNQIFYLSPYTGKFGHCATAETDFGKEKSGDIYTAEKREERWQKSHTNQNSGTNYLHKHYRCFQDHDVPDASEEIHVRGTNSSIISRNWRLFEAIFQNKQHSVRAWTVTSGISSYVDKIFFGRMPASRSNML